MNKADTQRVLTVLWDLRRKDSTGDHLKSIAIMQAEVDALPIGMVEPGGWKLVPDRADSSMLTAGVKELFMNNRPGSSWEEKFADAYSAALAAAPESLK